MNERQGARLRMLAAARRDAALSTNYFRQTCYFASTCTTNTTRNQFMSCILNCVTVAAGYDNRPSSYTNRALQRYFFDMRSEQLPPEAETVTGAVLRVYKFPAYVNMARTGAGDGHHRQLVLRVFMSGDDVSPDRLVTSQISSRRLLAGADRQTLFCPHIFAAANRR